MRIARNGFDDDSWEILRCCVTSLRGHARPIGGKVARSIARSGVFNPTDSVAKFMACLVCQGRPCKAIGTDCLKRLAAEHATAMIMLYNTHEANAGRPTGPADFIKPELLVNMPSTPIDPLAEEHPVELEPIPLRKGWLKRCADDIRAHPCYDSCWKDFKTFMLMLDANLKGPAPGELPDDFEVLTESQFFYIFAESLLIGKRTKRYKVVDSGPAKGTQKFSNFKNIF